MADLPPNGTPGTDPWRGQPSEWARPGSQPEPPPAPPAPPGPAGPPPSGPPQSGAPQQVPPPPAPPQQPPARQVSGPATAPLGHAAPPGAGGPGYLYGEPPTALVPPARRRFDWKRLGLMALVIVPLVAGGLVITLIVGTNLGPGAFAVGFFTAIIPVPFLVACFLWLDRYEPEPWRYLGFVFAWGACVATSVALGVNTLGSWLFAQAGISSSADAVLVAPFIEETMKALGPVLLFVYLRRRRGQYLSVVDGIVYFGLSATGFAMAENILYLGGIYVTGSRQGGAVAGAFSVAALFVMRIVLSGFAHPLFTSMTGLGVGLSASTSNRRVRWLAPFAGWIGAMTLHASWNLMSSLGTQTLLIGYLAVMAPIFFAAVGVALWARGHEGKQVVAMLRPYVAAGWLSPPELGALSTMTRRMAARRWARRLAGPAGARAMEAYQFAVTTLALIRQTESRGGGSGDFRERERELLTQMAAYRESFTGRDPQMPRVIWDGTNYHVPFPDGSTRTLPPPPQPVVPLPVQLMPAQYGWSGYGWR